MERGIFCHDNLGEDAGFRAGGAATPHERLFIDMRVFFSEPEKTSQKEFMIHNPAHRLDYDVK